MWALAKVLDGFADLPNERFHTFAIKYNGEVVGELKWKYRPKNAGGYAWRALLFGAGDCGMDVSFYDARKASVLEWIKTKGLEYIQRKENMKND